MIALIGAALLIGLLFYRGGVRYSEITLVRDFYISELSTETVTFSLLQTFGRFAGWEEGLSVRSSSAASFATRDSSFLAALFCTH